MTASTWDSSKVTASSARAAIARSWWSPRVASARASNASKPLDPDRVHLSMGVPPDIPRATLTSPGLRPATALSQRADRSGQLNRLKTSANASGLTCAGTAPASRRASTLWFLAPRTATVRTEPSSLARNGSSMAVPSSASSANVMRKASTTTAGASSGRPLTTVANRAAVRACRRWSSLSASTSVSIAHSARVSSGTSLNITDDDFARLDVWTLFTNASSWCLPRGAVRPPAH